ncbi:MAG: hypothetical protein IT440_10915 [Phycisphaeraceae bacterium]|nr:hypothetical protein [Phycisphaeraceae bacterium]
MSHRHPLASGYALVMTLIILAMAGSLLVVSARRHLRMASDVARARRELERRWTALSLQRSITGPAIEKLLTDEEKLTGQPVSSLSLDLQLGAIAYHLVLADEQSKVNVNILLAGRNRMDVETKLNKMLGDASIHMAVDLRPLDRTDDSPGSRPIQSWSQVFSVHDWPNETEAKAAATRDAMDLITCWGNGQIHFRRAPNLALHAALEDVLDRLSLDKLTQRRQSSPDMSLDEIVKSLALTEKQSQLVRDRLTDKSAAWSLRLEARQQPWKEHCLYVYADMSPNSSNLMCVTW